MAATADTVLQLATAVVDLSAMLGHRVADQVTGRALSAESTTSRRGMSASSAKPLARRAAAATAAATAAAAAATAAAATEDAEGAQAARGTGNARLAKSTTSLHVTCASVARSRNQQACQYAQIILLDGQLLDSHLLFCAYFVSQLE